MEHRHLDDELKVLSANILKMGSLVEELIVTSVDALKSRSLSLAKEVIGKDKFVDILELEIDEHCLKLLALQQPMAADLRFTATAMLIATDLERMADLAVDIAQRTIELGGEPHIKPLVDIPKMAEIARKMLKNTLKAFVNRDIVLAKQVYYDDDEEDRLRDDVHRELMDIMTKDGSTVPKAIPLLLVSRYLERICDHATNIAENIIYIVQGEMAKHNPEFFGRVFPS